MQLAKVAVPPFSLYIPPPCSATFALNVQLVRRGLLWSLQIAPPWPFAALPAKTQPTSTGFNGGALSSSLHIPPPSSAAKLFAKMQPISVGLPASFCIPPPSCSERFSANTHPFSTGWAGRL